jgi:predicted DNA-binding protein with PD1-like motif
MTGFTLLNEGPPRVFAVVLDTQDSVVDELVRFATHNEVSAAGLTAIGAFGTATLGFFDLADKGYVQIDVDQQAEVLSLVGDIARDDAGEVAVHVHAVLGLRDGTTRGGHLLAATVRPTLEVVVTESPGYLRRRYQADVGLALVDLDTSGSAPPDRFDPEDPLRHGLAP